MSKPEDFKAPFNNTDLTMFFSFDNERQLRIENNSEILRWLKEVIKISRKQCLLLRA